MLWLRCFCFTASPCPREQKARDGTYPDAIVSILMSDGTKLQECKVREEIRNAQKCLLVSSYEQGLKLLRNTDQFIHHLGIVGGEGCKVSRLPLIHHGERCRTTRPRGACSRRLVVCLLMCGEDGKRSAWKFEAENLFMGKQGCGSQILIDKAATRVLKLQPRPELEDSRDIQSRRRHSVVKLGFFMLIRWAHQSRNYFMGRTRDSFLSQLPFCNFCNIDPHIITVASSC